VVGSAFGDEAGDSLGETRRILRHDAPGCEDGASDAPLLRFLSAR
jgi:hypothetical protein